MRFIVVQSSGVWPSRYCADWYGALVSLVAVRAFAQFITLAARGAIWCCASCPAQYIVVGHERYYVGLRCTSGWGVLKLALCPIPKCGDCHIFDALRTVKWWKVGLRPSLTGTTSYEGGRPMCESFTTPQHSGCVLVVQHTAAFGWYRLYWSLNTRG